MKIAPVGSYNRSAASNEKDVLMARSDRSVVADETKEQYGNQIRQARGQDAHELNQIVSASRILIIEGISGSGKDTFQKYLKPRLINRDVYDYSEGELLQSWNQLQIKGIFKLRIKFMRLFVDYAKAIVNRDKRAVFLLNRFHLSAYAMTVAQQPKLEKDYDEIIHTLRTLPVHVFILQLDESEIEKRSLHPERSGAWEKFQQEIVQREGFRSRLHRYAWQQELMLKLAERQQIPYSVIKSGPKLRNEWVRAPEVRSLFRHQPARDIDPKVFPRK